MLLAGVSPEGEQVGIMSPEKQAAVGAGGKDFCLTPREKQVIVFVVAGYTNKDIAHELGVSEQTIKHHVANIFDKLGVSNRLELSLFALHHRLTRSYFKTLCSPLKRRPLTRSFAVWESQAAWPY
jgi:DNA-binding CsgD family transcriptional regulator